MPLFGSAQYDFCVLDVFTYKYGEEVNEYPKLLDFISKKAEIMDTEEVLRLFLCLALVYNERTPTSFLPTPLRPKEATVWLEGDVIKFTFDDGVTRSTYMLEFRSNRTVTYLEKIEQREKYKSLAIYVPSGEQENEMASTSVISFYEYYGTNSYRYVLYWLNSFVTPATMIHPFTREKLVNVKAEIIDGVAKFTSGGETVYGVLLNYGKREIKPFTFVKEI
jgi:hypothetical protein